jgi:hypothetical protein
MMNAILENGPLNGQRQIVGAEERTFRTRAGMGQRVAYDDTGEIDPASGLRIFAFRPAERDQGGRTTNDGQKNDGTDE